MHWIFGAAACALAVVSASPLAAEEAADARLAAVADSYYDYQLEQFGLTENVNGSTERGASLWSVTPEAQRA
ncbi:MAG: hypothetical protein ACJAUS_002696, partial [Qipengyuania sp.]